LSNHNNRKVSKHFKFIFILFITRVLEKTVEYSSFRTDWGPPMHKERTFKILIKEVGGTRNDGITHLEAGD
jgi:hypothetical protein